MISIIMPVYNSEKYLDDAIMSVLNQTYKFFELLLIDDGSTDGSACICDTFKKMDARIKVYHKKNGGVCSARNLGISEACGEYIAFIDNDDIYDSEYLETLAKFIEKEDYDILKCGRKNIRITPNLEIVSIKIGTILSDKKYSFEEFLNDYYKIKNTGCMGSVWNGLYKKSFIESNGLKFREDLKHGNEDLIFNYEALAKRPSIAFSCKVLYTHYYRISHSTSTKFYEDQIYSRIKAVRLEQAIVSEIPKREDKNLITFEEIRECFRLISLCDNMNKKKEFTKYIESQMDMSFLEKIKCVQDKMTWKQKLDWLLFRHRFYGIYFSYRYIQRKIERLAILR